jgi:hypothetical protein
MLGSVFLFLGSGLFLVGSDPDVRSTNVIPMLAGIGLMLIAGWIYFGLGQTSMEFCGRPSCS